MARKTIKASDYTRSVWSGEKYSCPQTQNELTAESISVLRSHPTIGRLMARPTVEVVAAPTLRSQELFLQIGRKRYQVASIAEAVEMYSAARDNAEHGASKMPRVTIVNAAGTHLYGISYNGRVWDGNKPLDGMSSEQWVAKATGK